MGIEKINHPYIGVDEELFDIIYRHSFDRPRDIQQFGDSLAECISNLKKLTSNEEKIFSIKYHFNQMDFAIL